LQSDYRVRADASSNSSTVTVSFSNLPTLGAGAEALAIDEAGTTISGHAWDRSDLLHAVKWTQQNNGSWAITDLRWPSGAVSARFRGVNNLGDLAGNDFSPGTARAMLWVAQTGTFTVLGCSNEVERANVYGISADAQVVVGSAMGVGAAVWRPGSCREELPPLVAGGSSGANAVNGDGTIVGGAAAPTVPASSSVPVRWRNGAAQWVIEQIDTRSGYVLGSNGRGDLAGLAYIPCASADGCQRAMIWNLDGSSRQLDTLGGEDSWARDINASGEVVGASTAGNGINTGYFSSADVGMLQLPIKARWAAANALSDVRSDGTRLVVGMDARAEPIVWVVRTP
jgi:uncharacterized membrane protein